MINFIKRKLEKRKLKRTFKEYGYTLKEFTLPDEGLVSYAQWLHPFEKEKEFTQSRVNFYKNFIQKGDLVIDIGAHTGDTTTPMGLAAGPEGLVLALEPNPYVFKILDANAKLNTNRTNIIPLCLAATETDGEFTFNYSDASFCNGGFLSKIQNSRHNHNFELKIKGINLENYLRKTYPDRLPKLSLLKIDAEGYDKEIIKAMAGVISEYKPYILAECYNKLTVEERNELFELFESKGYEVFHIEDFDEGAPITKVARQDMTKWKHFEILAKPVGK